MTPEISYIVSAYDRPNLLPIVLYSLAAQTNESFEVIVTDNATDPKIAALQRKAVEQMHDSRFRYLSTTGKLEISDCYWSAEYGAKRARGRWLCFPCDDCYYVPGFAEKMLSVANRFGWEMVCCDVLYRWNSGQHGVLHADPRRAIAAKTAFLIRKDRFVGFRGKPRGEAGPCAADCAAILDAANRYPSGVMQEVLVVHN